MSKQTEALNLTGAAPFWEKRERRGKEQRLAEQQAIRKQTAANYEAQIEARHDQEINYRIFLRTLTEKLGISGLSIDRENPDQPELLAQQLRTIKSVFDQLHIASHLLNLSLEQNKLFSDFNWNSQRIVDIIPALDSEDLNHQNLSAFANSLRPTMFTDYGQILRVSEISRIEDPKERHQAVAQLMSELGIEKASVKKLTKFFETQPTLAQVREQIAKQQWLQRLFWKSASTLGLLLMTAGCVAVTPETTPPPETTVLEVTPEVRYTPTYNLLQTGGLNNPESLPTPTPLAIETVSKESIPWTDILDKQDKLNNYVRRLEWLNNSEYTMVLLVSQDESGQDVFTVGAVIVSGGTLDGSLTHGKIATLVIDQETGEEVLVIGDTNQYTYAVEGIETPRPEITLESKIPEIQNFLNVISKDLEKASLLTRPNTNGDYELILKAGDSETVVGSLLLDDQKVVIAITEEWGYSTYPFAALGVNEQGQLVLNLVGQEPVVLWEEIPATPTAEAPINELNIAKDKLNNEVSAELLQSFGYESWEKVGEEQAVWLKSILAGTDLNGLQIEMQAAINNGTFYNADGNISVEWKNRALELMMGVMKDKLRVELDTLTDPEAEGVDYPRLLESVITINGKAIPISLHHGSALYNLYRDKSDGDATTLVPGLISTYRDPDFQEGVSTIFEQFLIDRELDVNAGFAESSFIVKDGKIVNVGEVADAKRVGVEEIDKIEFFRLHEQELWVLENMQRDITPYALNPHYDGDAATPFIDFIWFIRGKTLTFVHVQPGNVDKEKEAWILYAVFRDSLAQAMANLSFALRAEPLESRVATNEYSDFYIALKGQVRKEIDVFKAKETQ